MKTAIKVLNILTIIGCIIAGIIMMMSSCAIGNLIASSGLHGYKSIGEGLGFLGFIIIAIPAIVCLIANIKLDSAFYKSDLTGIAILTLIFGNFLSGILMLCITDDQL